MICAPPIAGIFYRVKPELPFPANLGMISVSLLLIG